ncbi:unnamed protein product, partial [Musa banksii]
GRPCLIKKAKALPSLVLVIETSPYPPLLLLLLLLPWGLLYINHQRFNDCLVTSHRLASSYTYTTMEGMMKRHQVPAFGYWDYCDELPITRYFESAVQAGLIRGRFFGEDDDLFNVSAQVRPAYLNHHRKVKKTGDIGGEKHYGKGQQRKQVKVISDLRIQATPRRHRAPKAVDEDLYKIPPELLYQKPKRKRSLKKLWSGCMGLNSVA